VTHRFVLAHGFTQTSRSWSTIAQLLGHRLDDVDIVAVDLPGHGAAATVHGDLWDSAAHLLDAGGPGTYVGYSMGGRVALHAALLRPQMIERLVLIGATAGIEDPVERVRRRDADDTLADHIQAVGVEVFIDEWLANPLFAGLTSSTAGRDDRLRNTPAGLANSLRSTGTGTQTPLWERLGEIRCPTLVLAGALDAKFSDLGRRLATALPDATLVIVPGVGHSVHLEAPDATVDAIVQWIGL
jgi:2-succinyl-6-hydroxy-2,4-cyclohexadiene-1-carboxylate synthase